VPLVYTGGALTVGLDQAARKVLDQTLIFAEIDVPEDVSVVDIVQEL